MKVYFDNAATTPVDAEVFEVMKPYFTEVFGNPSSIHSYGRQVKAVLEKARKQIATILGAKSNQVVFTSGATEANNLAIRGLVLSKNIERVITSPIEHHAVLNTVFDLKNKVEVVLLKVDDLGQIDLNHLQELLKEDKATLVSLMHGNNEIGNLNPIKEIGLMCKEAKAYFHCDTVQTVGLGLVDLNELDIDLLVGSAHKFYGPKGVGFLISKIDELRPLVSGGGQERSVRSGTENVPGIAGMATALQKAVQNKEEGVKALLELKNYFIAKLTELYPTFTFNGMSADLAHSLPSVVNFSLKDVDNSMVLFNLDIAGVAVSGGSACSSGALKGSHVLNAIQPSSTDLSLRVSFGKQNTRAEIDYFFSQLASFL